MGVARSPRWSERPHRDRSARRSARRRAVLDVGIPHVRPLAAMKRAVLVRVATWVPRITLQETQSLLDLLELLRLLALPSQVLQDVAASLVNRSVKWALDNVAVVRPVRVVREVAQVDRLPGCALGEGPRQAGAHLLVLSDKELPLGDGHELRQQHASLVADTHRVAVVSSYAGLAEGDPGPLAAVASPKGLNRSSCPPSSPSRHDRCQYPRRRSG